TGSLLNQIGIELSEPILFGLGEGLGFIFWNMKIMEFPFIGGRIKPDALTQNISTNLNLKLEVKETSSIKKAWKNVKNNIESNIAVGLKLDCYYLDYYTNKIHFAGHYVTIYGHDEEFAYLVDSMQQGDDAKTTLKSLELARNEKGPMSSRNLSYTIQDMKKGYNLKKALVGAINNNAKDYLNPPIKNVGYKGVLKASEEIKKWFKNSKDIERDFKTTAMLMEEGGTGGALFRNLYRDFLKESYELLRIEKLSKAYKMFAEIAILWKQVSSLFEKTSKTKNIKYINQASGILIELSQKEKMAMELLLTI
ncbi:MAG: BtrH N-terminal domain-containing protein, partial [Desulfobacterales bacterium]|nr:BtrH N-terminal domain-containing protein [Desulfobacterales bacterium]